VGVDRSGLRIPKCDPVGVDAGIPNGNIVLGCSIDAFAMSQNSKIVMTCVRKDEAPRPN
jgi:hypothetical protein